MRFLFSNERYSVVLLQAYPSIHPSIHDIISYHIILPPKVGQWPPAVTETLPSPYLWHGSCCCQNMHRMARLAPVPWLSDVRLTAASIRKYADERVRPVGPTLNVMVIVTLTLGGLPVNVLGLALALAATGPGGRPARDRRSDEPARRADRRLATRDRTG